MITKLYTRRVAPFEFAVRNAFEAFFRASERQPVAVAAGLLSGWTALAAALWFAVLFAVVGAIGGLFGIGFLTFGIGQASQGFALAGGAAGFTAGFLAGFLGIFGGSISAAPIHVVASLVVGGIFASALTFIAVAFEGLLLDLRHYRRPSRRAEEGRLRTILGQVGTEMGLRFVPNLRIHDSPIPGVWMHTRHLVLSKGFITQMDDDEIAAVMAHELHHWSSGDASARLFVWACTFPLIVLVNIYERFVLVNPRLQRWSTVIAVLIWPAVVLMRFVVTPALMAGSRRLEYEADAAAIAAGYGAGLHSALTKLQDFEVARTGWEAALVRTHPPTEFRLEAIEEAVAPPARRRPTPAAAKPKATSTRRNAAT